MINTKWTPKGIRERAEYWYVHTDDKQRAMVDSAPRDGLEGVIADLVKLSLSTKRRLRNRAAKV
jgi:hypothetical protein